MVPSASEPGFGLDFLSQGCHAEVAAGLGDIPGVQHQRRVRLLGVCNLPSGSV